MQRSTLYEESQVKIVKVFVFCFFLFTPEMLTNAHTVRGKSTLKDVERFRKYGLFREHMNAMKNLNATKAKVILYTRSTCLYESLESHESECQSWGQSYKQCQSYKLYYDQYVIMNESLYYTNLKLNCCISL